jgi:hypothetical protein
MRNWRWKHNLARFWVLSGSDKLMLLHATVWLAFARLMLLVLPFRQLAERLSSHNDSTNCNPEPEILERIGYAVQVAANKVPWRSDCFPQSIAGWMLLKHYGYNSTIHLGVTRSGADELLGHAWVTCGDIVVTGGEDPGRFAEIHRLGG